LFGFHCLPRRTRPLFQRGGCPEEPALYFNEGVASGSRRVLFDHLAFLPRRMSYLPLPSSGRCLCLVVLSLSRFVSSLCLVVLFSSRFVSLFAFVRPLFCLRRAAVLSCFDLIGLDSMLPSSGRRFAPTGPSDLVFAVVTILLPGSHRCLRRLCHLCRPTHPPHTTTIPAEGGRGGGGLSARGRAWGGEEDREWSECSRRRCWICKGGPRLEFR
jgi:hypothetical protein